MELIIFIVLVCMFFPGGGGGYGPSGAEIIAGFLAGVVGLAIIGGVWFAGAWLVWQTMNWFDPAPGGAWGAFWLLMLAVMPIVGLGAFCHLFGYIDDRF